MNPADESSRILRTAAWIWLGFLIALVVMDILLYVSSPRQQGVNLQQNTPAQVQPLQPNSQSGSLPRGPFAPIYIYYIAHAIAVMIFFTFTYSGWFREKLGEVYFPFMVLIITVAPIFINVLVVPRFPQGPLSNAEGMALRQLPVLFVGLALVAWKYSLFHIVLFSLSTAVLEIGLLSINTARWSSVYVFVFIAIIRTISLIATGAFISQLVARLREQQESLRLANADLTHYASTLEQLAVSRERNRLARELHDTLAHSLTALSVSLEAAKAYFDVDPEKTRDLLDRSLDATRRGVDDTRRALKALRSSALEDMGLELALRGLTEAASRRAGLTMHIDISPAASALSPDVEQAIYRVAQEAIENVVRHGGARNLWLTLAQQGRITLTVQDDGIGFDADAVSVTGHFGLVGMQERAELAGGSLQLESKKGSGTKVILTL